jgi:hypothetical protein
MPIRGFSGSGFSFDNLLSGGGASDITISAATCINGVSGFANSTINGGGAQDFVCKNLTINSQFTPTVSDGSRCSSYKIFASGVITIGQNGGLRVDGFIPNAGIVPGSAGGKGYQSPFETASPFTPPYHSGPLVGTLGGSGTGGASAGSGTGGNGSPGIVDEEILFWGGSGGNGTGSPGGSGGFANPQIKWNNWFEPIVYQQGMFYTNLAASIGSDYPHALFPTRINGGCGGGGSSNETNPALGGGGAGGGVCWLSCSKLVMSGTNATITANGQNSTTGGGGGGGVVIIVTSKIVWNNATANITATGGTGANAGGNGRILIFSNELVGMFTSGTLNKASYDAAVIAYNS